MNDKDRTVLKDFLFPDRTSEQIIMDRLHMASALERICRLKYKEKEKTKDFCLQIHNNKIQAFCINSPGRPPYELKNRYEAESFCFELFECEQTKEPFGSGIPALLMSKRKFEELNKSSELYTVNTLSDCLAVETGDDIHSVQLARVMKCSHAQGELRFCTADDNGWRFHYATFIADCSNGWLMRMSSDVTKDWIIALPITKAQLCCSITEWVLDSVPLFNPE